MKRIILFSICVCCIFAVSCRINEDKRVLQYNESIVEINKAIIGDSSIGLIGYDDEYVYYSQVLDDCINFYKSKDDLVTEMYVSTSEVITYQEVYDGKIFLCEVEYADNMGFSVKMIDTNNVLEICGGECYGLPEVRLIGDKLVIGYSIMKNDSIIQSLQLYDLISGSGKDILNRQYHIDEMGYVTGTLLQSFDGFEHGIVIEEIEFNKENMYLDETGEVKLYYYDFASGDIEKIPITTERKFTYVVGDAEYVITSDYANKEPLVDTGKIYFLQEDYDSSLIIEGIESGNDIVDAYKISDDVLLIQTRLDLYVMDLNTHKYKRMEGITNVKVYGESFAYFNQNKELVKCSF